MVSIFSSISTIEQHAYQKVFQTKEDYELNDTNRDKLVADIVTDVRTGSWFARLFSCFFQNRVQKAVNRAIEYLTECCRSLKLEAKISKDFRTLTKNGSLIHTLYKTLYKEAQQEIRVLKPHLDRSLQRHYNDASSAQTRSLRKLPEAIQRECFERTKDPKQHESLIVEKSRGYIQEKFKQRIVWGPPISKQFKQLLETVTQSKPEHYDQFYNIDHARIDTKLQIGQKEFTPSEKIDVNKIQTDAVNAKSCELQRALTEDEIESVKEEALVPHQEKLNQRRDDMIEALRELCQEDHELFLIGEVLASNQFEAELIPPIFNDLRHPQYDINYSGQKAIVRTEKGIKVEHLFSLNLREIQNGKWVDLGSEQVKASFEFIKQDGRWAVIPTWTVVSKADQIANRNEDDFKVPE